MAEESNAPRSRALSAGYFVGEMAIDASVGWIIYTQGHPWFAMLWLIQASFSANRNAKRHAGLPVP